MAFNLAASQKFAQYLGHKPIGNVTFGSPYVGGHVWAEAFQVSLLFIFIVHSVL